MAAQPVKLNLKVIQGSTFRETLRWESGEKVYVPITNITKAAPVVVQADNHGVPQGWRVKITGCAGMKEINSDSYVTATIVTTNNITVNSINALSYTTYTGGGVVEYNKPVDLTNMTGRMQIRQKLDDPTVIKELTSANGGIVVDNTTKTIQLLISATDTAAFTFQSAVYSLEIVNGTEITQLVNGTLTLVKEVTR